MFLKNGFIEADVLIFQFYEVIELYSIVRVSM